MPMSILHCIAQLHVWFWYNNMRSMFDKQRCHHWAPCIELHNCMCDFEPATAYELCLTNKYATTEHLALYCTTAWMNLKHQQHIKHGNGSGSGGRVCLPNSYAQFQGNITTLIEQTSLASCDKGRGIEFRSSGLMCMCGGTPSGGNQRSVGFSECHIIRRPVDGVKTNSAV